MRVGGESVWSRNPQLEKPVGKARFSLVSSLFIGEPNG
jgi:hypothetical protein